MKSAGKYIVFFGVLFLISTLVVVALVMLKPELFPLPGGQDQVAADSTRSQAPLFRTVAGPTLAELQGPDSSALLARDSIAQLKDSLGALASLLQHERQRSDSLSRPKPVPKDTVRAAAIDTAKVKERKNMAKMLESMPAENAAQILKDLPDEEMKALLMNVKKRQAAKILGAIEPSRASKLFR
jgi:flagellar motility protein MotE (MotC chaperone)